MADTFADLTKEERIKMAIKAYVEDSRLIIKRPYRSIKLRISLFLDV